MYKKKLKVLAVKLVKGLKTEANLNPFSCMLIMYLTVKTALNAQLPVHLGHEKMPKNRL